MVKISKIVSGDQESFKCLLEYLKLNYLVYFIYVLITVSKRETFLLPVYNYNVLTDNRTAFKFDNIGKCTIQLYG